MYTTRYDHRLEQINAFSASYSRTVVDFVRLARATMARIGALIVIHTVRLFTVFTYDARQRVDDCAVLAAKRIFVTRATRFGVFGKCLRRTPE